MIKRTTLSILISVLITTVSVRAQWDSEECPSGSDLNAVCFVNVGLGWTVGNNGTILNKINGRWFNYLSPTKENLYSLEMLNKDSGWAVGANGTIIHFNGSAWEKMESPTDNDLFSVSFKDPDNGVITGENGTILRYKDKIWNKLDKNIRANLYAAQFFDEDIVFGGGMELLNVPLMKIQSSTGNSITSLFDSNIAVTGIVFTGPDNAWVIGSPSTILHYDGENWIKPELDFKFPSLNHISFTGENMGICVGFSGTILIFTGTNWIKEDPVTNEHLNGSVIVNNSYYVVGDNGTILVRHFNNETGETQQSDQAAGNIGLFPNPCDDLLNVDLTGLPDDPSGIVLIMNLKGEILDQKQINISKGNLHLTIETSGYKSGIYFIKVITGGKVLLSRFIVN